MKHKINDDKDIRVMLLKNSWIQDSVKLKPIIMGGRQCYCLADTSDGHILNTTEVHHIFAQISDFYNKVPNVDELVDRLNKGES